MHLNLKIGVTVAVDVTFHQKERAFVEHMQLACLVVKVVRADEVEVLVAGQSGVGVNAADVDVVELAANAAEIHNHIVVGAFRRLGLEIEIETVGIGATRQGVFAAPAR